MLRRWPEEIDNPGGVRGDRAPVTRCLQRPGSILFLPSQWWHATLNVDDCVGVGGHMHDGIDRAFKAQVVARVGTEEKRVTEYGWEVHPFSGQMTMTLARRKMKVGKPVTLWPCGAANTFVADPPCVALAPTGRPSVPWPAERRHQSVAVCCSACSLRRHLTTCAAGDIPGMIQLVDGLAQKVSHSPPQLRCLH